MKTTLSALVLALAVPFAAHAADAASTSRAKAQFEKERAACMSGMTGQTQASCLKSAGAAYDEARKHELSNPNTDYRANALARCKNLPERDRLGCEQRVDLGTASSNVKGGGDLKETVTIQTPPPRAAQ